MHATKVVLMDCELATGVAVDGSLVSGKALELAGRLLNLDRGDKLFIVHVTDP